MGSRVCSCYSIVSWVEEKGLLLSCRLGGEHLAQSAPPECSPSGLTCATEPSLNLSCPFWTKNTASRRFVGSLCSNEALSIVSKITEHFWAIGNIL